jgi:hypothetical protein
MAIALATEQEHADVLELEPAQARPLATAQHSALSPRAEVVDAAASLLQVISAAARDPSVDIEKMERLMAMHERMTARTAEAAFNDAMALTQAEMTPISCDAVNPQTKSRYATYAQLDAALRPIYTKHGFSISFNTGADAPEGHLRLLALVGRGGHTRTYMLDMPSDGKGAKGGDVMTKTHATGAASTYGQRYLLKLIFNVAVGELDNDGNGMTREQWLASWLNSIAKSRNVGELRRVMADAMDEADHERDQDAKDRFLVAQADKMAKAKVPTAAPPPAPTSPQRRGTTPSHSAVDRDDPPFDDLPY